MKTKAAIAYFTLPGDTLTGAMWRLAHACGVNRTSIYDWGEIVPDAYATRLHLLTGGDLNSGIRPTNRKKFRAIA